jgi:hypothetical protein
MHGKVEMAARDLERVDDEVPAQPRAPTKRREGIDTPRRLIPPMA